MHTTSFFKRILFVVSVLFLYSCDKEYNTIGADLLGENHFDFLQYSSDVVAHNQKLGPVDATDLPINALGIYDDPAFGKTTAHFATQLNLAALAPTIGYDKAAHIAKTAHKNGTTLKQEVIKAGLIKENEYDKIMNPLKMTKPK